METSKGKNADTNQFTREKCILPRIKIDDTLSAICLVN